MSDGGFPESDGEGCLQFWHTAVFKRLAWLERQGHEIGASESKLRSKTLISDICSHFPSEHRESLQVLLQR